MLLPTLTTGLLGFSSALLLVWGSVNPAQNPALQQLIAVLASMGLGGTAVLWVALDRRFSRLGLGWVLLMGLLLRLVAIVAHPLLEDDYFRYLWDGWRTVSALDPYRLPPSAFFSVETLPSVWQDILGGINYPDVPTIYGPVLQWFFALAHLLAPGEVMAIQALLLLLDMTLLGLLALRGVDRRGVLIYALHPLVLKEAMASAHPDGLMALLLLLAVFAWQRKRAFLMGVLLGSAVCAKVAALVALPLMLLAPSTRARGVSWLRGAIRNRWLGYGLLGFALSVTALYLPFIWGGGNEAAGLIAFGTQWRYNPMLFRLIEWVVPESATRWVAACMILGGLGWLAYRWRTAPSLHGLPLPPLDTALLLLILLSPVVNPWYWLWLLPISLMMGQGWLAVAACTMPLAYLNSTVLTEAGLFAYRMSDPLFVVQWPAALVQMLCLLMAWFWRDRLRLSPRRTSGEPGASTAIP